MKTEAENIERFGLYAYVEDGNDAVDLLKKGSKIDCVFELRHRAQGFKEHGFKVVMFNAEKRNKYNACHCGFELFQAARYGGTKQAEFWVVDQDKALELDWAEDRELTEVSR